MEKNITFVAMIKQVFALFCAFLAVINATLPTPFDLADEAVEQVDELNSIVQGEILTAHDDLNNLITEYSTNSINTAQNGQISLQQQEENINSRLAAFKELADSANADISECTDERELDLGRLPSLYSEQIGTCIAGNDDEATRITSDAIYIIDVVINKVEQLKFQIGQCKGEILCISPLVTQIELDKIRLPQNIRTEVQASENLLTTLRSSVQFCSDQFVSGYATQAYNILSNIAACVSRIIG